jgi:membrane-bound metal-dependent hydrolase YbcI (DUF457 family)
MVAGHFGFAALVKARERQTPLWALMLACQWLDVVFVPLFAAHLESLVPVAGSQGGYGENIIYADYTHSLLGALALSAALGALGALWWGRRSGVVLGAVAFSHWGLDLVVHRGDLPLLPGDAGHLPRLGFGLWRLPWLALTVELLLVAGGAYAYWRAASETAAAAGRGTRIANLAGALLLAFGVVTLTLSGLGQ